MRPGVSGVFLCIAGESVGAGLLEYREWAGIRSGLCRAVGGGRRGVLSRRASNIPEMEYWAGRCGSERV
jgi:hypothetical protein